MLDSHPEIVADAESMVTPDGQWVNDPAIVYRKWKKATQRYAAKEPRFITPQCLGPLKKTFRDDVYLINLIRNPYDTLISYMKTKTEFNFLPFAKSFLKAHKELAKREWPTKYYIIRYEDIVANPQESMTKLCNFIGVDFHPDMLQHHKKSHDMPRRDEKVAYKNGLHYSMFQSTKPLFSSSVGQFEKFLAKGWKPSKEQLTMCREMAVVMGYQPISLPSSS